MRLAMTLQGKGAADLIKTPFPSVGRTLDRVIKKALGLPLRAKRPGPRAGRQAGPSGQDGWLTVTEAAQLLAKDLPWLDTRKARARVSTAANRKEFRTNGKSRRERRIEPHSFDSWRLRQRDRDLDDSDRQPDE
jgi:hypothetical protein